MNSVCCSVLGEHLHWQVWATEGPGWPLNVVYNSPFLWLRFAAALGMFKYPCLLYFPRAVLHAIPSVFLQPPFQFSASEGLSDPQTSSCPSLAGWWHRKCLSWKFPHCAECEEQSALVSSSFIGNERDGFENQGAQKQFTHLRSNLHFSHLQYLGGPDLEIPYGRSIWLKMCYIKEIFKRSWDIIIAKEWL